MSITADIQQLEPGHRIELFEVNCTEIGGDALRFHGHLQSTSIVWQGLEYKPWPIQAAGFERTSDARQPAPTLTVGDINGTITALCVALDDLVGAKVIRRRTLAKYLDAVNFPNGNPTADPNEQWPPEQWRIEQKSDEQPGVQVEFTLSSPLDFGGQQVRLRIERDGHVLVGAVDERRRTLHRGATRQPHACRHAGQHPQGFLSSLHSLSSQKRAKPPRASPQPSGCRRVRT